MFSQSDIVCNDSYFLDKMSTLGTLDPGIRSLYTEGIDGLISFLSIWTK
jgi:hypothetical protein